MGLYRRVIRITGDDSPNVKLARAQIAKGLQPTGELLVPGVLPWADYCKRMQLWDEVRRSVGIHAQFWEGREVLLFPPDWLNRAETLAVSLRGKLRSARAVGVDTAEGGDLTSMAAVDDLGVLALQAKRTPDTDVVVGEVRAFAMRYSCPMENVVFDLGGGGKEHADRMRAKGWPVRTIGFGGRPTLELKRGLYPLQERKEVKEEKYAYVSMRAQMYGELALLLDPGRFFRPPKVGETWPGFAVPAEFGELRRQLARLPKLYNEEGRMRMLPKRNPKDPKDPRTLVALLGRSPDEADSVVLAVHGMLHRSSVARAGAM